MHINSPLIFIIMRIDFFFFCFVNDFFANRKSKFLRAWRKRRRKRRRKTREWVLWPSTVKPRRKCRWKCVRTRKTDRRIRNRSVRPSPRTANGRRSRRSRASRPIIVFHCKWRRALIMVLTDCADKRWRRRWVHRWPRACAPCSPRFCGTRASCTTPWLARRSWSSTRVFPKTVL